MAHEQLTLNLVYRVESHADDDENGSSSEIEACYAHKLCHQVRHQCDPGEKYRAAEGDPAHDFFNKVRGRFARTYAENETAVFFHVVRHVGRIENNSGVKIAEEHNERNVAQSVYKASGPENPLEEKGNISGEELRYGIGKQQH